VCSSDLEKSWKELNRKLRLKTAFVRLDKLTGLGRYGVLLLGFDDMTRVEDFVKPVTSKNLKLLYVRPLSEASAKIDKWEKDHTNPRYGLPLIYDISLSNPEESRESLLKVHWSRVIHVTDNSLESDTEGSPRLEPIYNRLDDIEKITGGSAEMFWRGARPGYAGEVDKDFTMSTADETDLKAQIDEYENDLRRLLVNRGVKLTALDQQVANPKDHFDVQIQAISAQTGIPKRILSGSERGELSSGQDSQEWISYVQSRREEFAEPHVIRPFVDRMIEYGVLPTPSEGYDIEWQDLFSISEEAKVKIGMNRAIALREYFSQPLATEVVAPRAFYEFFLGLTREQIELIQEMESEALDLEGALFSETSGKNAEQRLPNNAGK
jgi:hypothetical protein